MFDDLPEWLVVGGVVVLFVVLVCWAAKCDSDAREECKHSGGHIDEWQETHVVCQYNAALKQTLCLPETSTHWQCR